MTRLTVGLALVMLTAVSAGAQSGSPEPPPGLAQKGAPQAHALPALPNQLCPGDPGKADHCLRWDNDASCLRSVDCPTISGPVDYRWGIGTCTTLACVKAMGLAPERTGWRPAGDGCNWTNGTMVTLANCASHVTPATCSGPPEVCSRFFAQHQGCDLAELLAASRVWHATTAPGVVDGITLGWWDAGSLHWKREQEQRWRRAVEACR